MASYPVPGRFSFEALEQVLTPLLVPGNAFKPSPTQPNQWQGIVIMADMEMLIIKWSKKKNCFFLGQFFTHVQVCAWRSENPTEVN
jgi:hypothetical protein